MSAANARAEFENLGLSYEATGNNPRHLKQLKQIVAASNAYEKMCQACPFEAYSLLQEQ